jgi:shikimate kinase
MMGAGKSALGRLVAERTGERFADTDQVVEEEAGQSISEIWAGEGESGFRRREQAAIASLASEGTAVIATGGGAVLDPGNVDLMRSSGTVVWLDARPTTLAGRLGGGEGRPLLSDAEPLPAIIDLLNQRRPFYLAAAHLRVNTDGRPLEVLAGELEELWIRS